MSTLVSPLVGLCGFAAALLFILGLKRMSSPASALSGIMLAGIGMIAAIASSVIALPDLPAPALAALPLNAGLALIALILGGGWAWWRGRHVAMTAMPQMVALYNGMGGGAAAAVAAVALTSGIRPTGVDLAATLAGALIGAISLSGSVIAWAKLDGSMGSAWRFRGQRLVNVLVMLAALVLGALIAIFPMPGPVLTGGFFAMALLFGIAMTLPIGGADMPVVISLYNAFTGLAVGLEGYALGNPALMIAGMVVGSAGTLLTLLMAKAMNRSLTNVLFSDFGETGASASGTEATRPAKSAEASDAALPMRYAGSVVIVPGYGLAVAQAQQKLYELIKLLQAAGVGVKFAIHPVAGRMPGHMNVLLAEAGVPYDLIFDMDEINDDFDAVDVALVIGANDVVNPAARSDKTSPIYGMPILNVDRAHQVYVIKRGQGKGYAGVENLLFGLDNCAMVYGDAQAVLAAMVQALKDSG